VTKISIALLLLAGCGGSGAWTKPGADDAATAQAYQECRTLTDTATQTDANVDQDIAASRASDLQRASILRAQSQQITEVSRDRANAILASCMQAKGFTLGPK
jgi:hypothetical protein